MAQSFIPSLLLLGFYSGCRIHLSDQVSSCLAFAIELKGHLVYLDGQNLDIIAQVDVLFLSSDFEVLDFTECRIGGVEHAFIRSSVLLCCFHACLQQVFLRT